MDVIVRFSLNDDRSSALRNKLKPILEQGGIRWDSTTTATYRGHGSSAKELADTMMKFWEAVHRHKGKATFDHFWMYADNPPPLDAEPPLEELLGPQPNDDREGLEG